MRRDMPCGRIEGGGAILTNCIGRVTTVIAVAAMSLLIGGGGGVGGCAENDVEMTGDEIRLDVAASHPQIVAGETVTFTTHTENLYGRDANIEWTASGGDLETSDNGRLARVQFDEPGVYTVTARLFIDGREIRNDSAIIEVTPLR